MSNPDLKVVGEIRPPEYKDPVLMLRNLADDIEAGEFGDGRVSNMAQCAFLFGAAATRFHMIPWMGE